MVVHGEIYMFLSSHSWDEVKEAFKQLNRDRVHRSLEHTKAMVEQVEAAGWSEHEGEVPTGFEWRRIGNRLFIRDPSIPVVDPSRVTVQGSGAAARQPVRKKTDTSVKRVEDLACPKCGGEMFKEGICPGCDEGKRGLKVRLICGECDYVLAL